MVMASAPTILLLIIREVVFTDSPVLMLTRAIVITTAAGVVRLV